MSDHSLTLFNLNPSRVAFFCVSNGVFLPENETIGGGSRDPASFSIVLIPLKIVEIEEIKRYKQIVA